MPPCRRPPRARLEAREGARRRPRGGAGGVAGRRPLAGGGGVGGGVGTTSAREGGRRRRLKRGSGPASRRVSARRQQVAAAAAIHGAVFGQGDETAPPDRSGSHEMRRVERGWLWRSRRALQRRAKATRSAWRAVRCVLARALERRHVDCFASSILRFVPQLRGQAPTNRAALLGERVAGRRHGADAPQARGRVCRRARRRRERAADPRFPRRGGASPRDRRPT